jgi:hypothetical protein
MRLLLTLGIVAAAAALLLVVGRAPRDHGPLPQGVYVWQRAVTPEVRAAIEEVAGRFAPIVALAAEVSFREGRMEVARTDLPPLPPGSGFALRVGPCPGALPAGPLRDLAVSLPRGAELQIDYDCPESRLFEFARFVASLGEGLSGTPLVVTALPAWLDAAGFDDLIDAADGYVLQVHSLERPRSPDRVPSLCDVERAAGWVERAARRGRPFRVALPSYGYDAAFDAAGALRWIAAEGPEREPPEGGRVVRIAAEPAPLAGLVRRLRESRPRELRGILWYRLPVPGDRRNWRLPTLLRVAAGEAPAPALSVEVVRTEGALADFAVVNRGEGEHSGPIEVVVAFRNGDRVDLDALAGFRWTEPRKGEIRFRVEGARLAPGDRRAVGWIRFHGAVEIDARSVP